MSTTVLGKNAVKITVQISPHSTETKVKVLEPVAPPAPETEELEVLVAPEEEEAKSDVKTIQVDTKLLEPKL